MATTGSYYLDAPTLSTATAIYIDSGLTTFASIGYYSDGLVTREWLGSGGLLPAQLCQACTVPCNPITILSPSTGDEGYYQAYIDTGTATGAILVKFAPMYKPRGIRAAFGPSIYNKLSSPIDGVHQSTGSSNFTWVGVTSYDCSIVAGSPYAGIPNYVLNTVSNYTLQGSSSVVAVLSGDVSLTSTTNNAFNLMVIPKTTATPSLLTVIVASVCPNVDGTLFQLQISCPQDLPSVQASVVSTDSELVCAEDTTSTYYFASLTGSSTTLDIYDYVFTDVNGETPLADGWYKINNNGTDQSMEVQNGVIITLNNCPF
jgi:hypothetical protein